MTIGMCGKRPIYSRDMSRIVRSAMLQMRVSPEIKLASEHVLRRIGLNLTEATELFLRRMIIDQRIPFEVIAVDNATYAQLVSDWEEEAHMMEVKRRSGSPKSLVKARVGSKRE
jgi:addiction module RelB/DinJ family antitoxin